MEKKIYNYALNPDSETLKQFKSCYSQDYVVKAALMPDAHSGYVAPIGAVLATKNYIVPSWVGFDIGCGLISVKLSHKNIIELIQNNSEKIYNKVNQLVPMGKGETSPKLSKETETKFNELIKKLEKSPHDKSILNMIKTSGRKFLGTLGGGNHFIELNWDKENENEAWITIHSGSRGLGHKIATHYMKKASNSKTEYEVTNPLEISSELGKQYLAVLDFCLDYALLNRLEMSNRVVEALESVLKIKLSPKLWANKNHNHAILENKLYVHRKGATPATKKEKGIIPANMRDGTILVEGLGNPNFLYSSSHGAGRVMSRTQAKSKISMKEFKSSMEGIKGTISQKTLDEAPQAYKQIDLVMEAQKESVKKLKHLYPLINWKG